MLLSLSIFKYQYPHNYDVHSTKITDIFVNNYKTKGYSELTVKYPSIHQYYMAKAPKEIRNMCYVYISTCNNVGKLMEDATKYVLDYGILSTDASLYKQLKFC